MKSIFFRIAVTTVVFSCLLLAATRTRIVRASLGGFQEVPAVSSEARGAFLGRINADSSELGYELEYSGLEGDVRQAHIHLGARASNGGIMIWLCGTATNPSPVAGTPTCLQEGTINGTVTAADVIGPAGQGVAAGEFAEALNAIREGLAYANVHTSKFTGGEIRGQIHDENRN
jgi:hypothetical protein